MLNDLLLPMFDDGYYPQILVAEIKQDLIDFSRKIQANPKTESEIYQLADSTLLKINEMKADFEDLDSSLDDTATDYIAEAMMMVVQDAGYLEIDLEELVASRAWYFSCKSEVIYVGLCGNWLTINPPEFGLGRNFDSDVHLQCPQHLILIVNDYI